MKMQTLIGGVLAAFALMGSSFAGEADWFRDPAISPDGSTILFSARGDIYRVGVEGGVATPVTIDPDWDGMPIWSRDGAMIAFASDRHGDLDVFVMPAEGGRPKRLTHHSSDDRPSDFSPDGRHVLFSSARTDSARSSYFPTGALPELYEVSIDGGTPRMVFTNPAEEAKWSPDGSEIAYREEKAYEDEYRKRDVSSFARDLWIHDVESGAHRKITDFEGGDHSPVWDPNGGGLYYLSEEDGPPFNVRRLDFETGATTRMSTHAEHPARDLSASAAGDLVYSHHGEIFLIRSGGSPEKVAIRLFNEGGLDEPLPMDVSGEVSEFALSPDGKDVAFVARGDVFVASMEFGTTVQVTATPEQERSISYDPDGRSIVYAAERGGAWRIMETALADENEPRFSAATKFEESEIYAVEGGEAFQPLVSPDGEKIAYVENRDSIRVIDRDGGNPTTIFTADQNYSYADGDIAFDWSPDGAWLTADYVEGGIQYYRFGGADVGVAPTDGSAPPRPVDLTGYSDVSPVWHGGGDVIYWYTNRFGERSHGSFGGEFDVMAAFLTQEAWDRFNLTKEERALVEEAEEGDGEKDEKNDKKSSGGLLPFFKSKKTESDGKSPLAVKWEGLEERTARLTIHSSDLAAAALSSDLSKLYYLSAFEGGFDLWVHDLHEGETKRLAELDAGASGLVLTKDDANVVFINRGRLMSVDLDSGAPKPIGVSAEMIVKGDAERAHLFEHVWRQVKDKFYDPDYHGLDWAAMKAAYEPKVAGISHNRDFAVLLSEMLGQLNASHTGSGYIGGREEEDDATAALGAIFDFDDVAGGILISEILTGGPLDKAGLGVEAGQRITAVDGRPVGADGNFHAALNRKGGERVRLTLKPARGDAFDVVVRTYSRSEESQALYERWIDRRRAIVEAASGGRVGYLHVRSMSDAGFRQTYDALYGPVRDKEAVIVDTRFNGGGWLHDDLIVLLSGEPYYQLAPRGRVIHGEPLDRWIKPSAVVMNEGNYSDAYVFPFGYSKLGIGPTIGMPVPGTGTAVWWETLHTGDLFFGIPQLPLYADGRPVENRELQPDHLVDNPPEAAARGEDLPLIKAVEVLLEGSPD